LAKKAVVTIKGVGAAQANALKFLNNVAKDKRILDSIGADLADQINKRTAARLDEYKQKPLAESTVVSRDIATRVNNLDQLTKPKTSNLTLSGQLLSSIKNKSDAATAQIIIFLKEGRNKLKKPTLDQIKEIAKSKPKKKQGFYYAIGHLMMQAKDENKNNTEIKNDLEKQGRKFLFMSDKLQTMLEVKLRQQIAKQLSLYNKVKRKLTT
jgi:hypothetical protein